MRNLLTVDVEDWYMGNDLDIPLSRWNAYEDRVVESTERVLELFAEYGVTGTFFVLGCVAQKFPQLVRAISDAGHEIGSHGGWHQLLQRMTPEAFRADVRFSKGVLEDACGQAVTAFRMPSWSLSADRWEALRILSEEGFTHDSSLQPFATPLSGVKGAPIAPFYPVIAGDRLSILEIPSTVLQWGRQTLPFAGGLYLRMFPVRFVQWGLHRVNQSRMGMVYVHPWELDVEQPRITRSPLLRFTHYAQLHKTEPKLRRLLSSFEFGPLCDVLLEGGFPDIELTGLSK